MKIKLKMQQQKQHKQTCKQTGETQNYHTKATNKQTKT